MADPLTRRVGERLGTLQRTLMSMDGTREQFAELVHAIDNSLGEHTQIPGRASLIAYADLQVQWQTADRRWPRAAPEAGPPGAADPA